MNRKVLTLVAAGLAIPVSSAHAQTDWLNTLGGSWLSGTNWSSGLPNSTTDATLGLANPYVVDIATGNATVRDLLILNGAAALDIASARQLTVHGNMFSSGLITVNPTGGASSAIVQFNAPASMLDGPGIIRLNAVVANNDAYLTHSVSTNVVTNGGPHVIEGSGEIYVNVNNLGLIQANVAGKPLVLRTTAKSNSGVLLATGGGILDIDGITISGTGQIRAEAGSTVRASGAINGGTFLTLGTGLVQSEGTLSLDKVNILGDMHVRSGDQVNVTGDLTLTNGTITVNPTGGSNSGILSFNSPTATIVGPGTIVLNAVVAPNDAYLTYNNSMNMVTSQVTITGEGEIYTQLENDGLVLADGAGKTINLRTTSKINNTNMVADNGGELLFTSNVDQTGGGLLLAQNGGFLTFSGMTLTGGEIQSSGALARVIASAIFNGVKHSGPLNIAAGVPLSITNDLTNNGSVLVNATGGASTASMIFNTNGGSILGSGEIVLNAVSSANDAHLTYSASTNLITNTVNHTIRGAGQVYTHLLNEGLVSADVPGKVLELRTTNKMNHGVMRADGGTLRVSSITIDQTATPEGVIEAVNGGTIELTGTVVNGTIDSTDGVATLTSTLNVDGVTLEGTLDIPGGVQLNVNNQGMTNNGTVLVNSNASASTAIVSINLPALTIDGTGEIVLDAIAAQNDAYITYNNSTNVFTNGAGHTIAGNGIIYVKTTNQGTLSPGHALTGDLTQKFSLELAGDVTCAPTSVVEIDLEGSTAGDFDFITGAAAIDFVCDGTLVVNHVGGYTGPAWGTAIDFIDVGVVSGTFSSVQLPQLSGDDRYAVVYLSDRVRLLVTCNADCDANLTLDFFDFLCFQNEFNAASPYADCDGSGVHDFFDFLCYQNQFNLGCQ